MTAGANSLHLAGHTALALTCAHEWSQVQSSARERSAGPSRRPGGWSYLGWLLAARSSEEVGAKTQGPLQPGVRPPDR